MKRCGISSEQPNRHPDYGAGLKCANSSHVALIGASHIHQSVFCIIAEPLRLLQLANLRQRIPYQAEQITKQQNCPPI
jgi:hypothetical protein